ncbi:MAG TPA: glycerophosphodiester phosphodiesterase, partial [Euryarchaeota archaeon]|nr:glycerophosphodiester phosphodiesterase [Euryarchaeota archaeon]
VRTCHDLGLRVNVWTPNTREEMGRCLRMGVDGLITDLPDTALEMISLHGSDP